MMARSIDDMFEEWSARVNLMGTHPLATPEEILAMRRARSELTEPNIRPTRPPKQIKHGTNSGYTNDRCRCEPCRKAANAARLARIHAKKEAAQ